ncbi:MAG TPA: hypothetical protein VHD35_08135 [Chitinophagaceae bacterium]|nr:hypothetical protein [Chitinophagaceae bacterium]
MEVHHHPHVEKKNFKEYFLEFLMIFLAVTLGFFAENFREHRVESSREKQYIISMIADLRKDSTYLQLCLDKFIPAHETYLDSLIYLLKSNDPGKEGKKIYFYFINATTWSYNYVPTQRTLSQLRTSGFTLIKNELVADILSELEIDYAVYNKKNDFVQGLQNDIDQSAFVFADKSVVASLHKKQFSGKFYQVLDIADVPPEVHLMQPTLPDLNNYIEKLIKYNYFLKADLQTEYIRISQTILRTINMLQKEYHLK